MANILVVDDVLALRQLYSIEIKEKGKHNVDTAEDGLVALQKLKENSYDCMILDLEMPRADGFEVLTKMNSIDDNTPVIVYTSTGNYQSCIRAVRLGAFGFIDKNESIEKVLQEIDHALHNARVEAEIKRLKSKTTLIGKSRAMEDLKKRIAKLAPIPSPVLVLGPSGSGKELVVDELHKLGAPEDKKDNRPKVTVLCSAISAGLIESELFGHEKGAFTGADSMRKGKFEEADGGTIFLDEIGELSPEAQAKLLRVLEKGDFQRTGSNKEIKVKVRVIAATHRNLEKMVEEGLFREDLLYRLNMHTLIIPALKERISDLPLLLNHFLMQSCENMHCKIKKVSPEAETLLKNYEWGKNNVRELKNAVEQMVFNCDDDTILPEHLPLTISGAIVANTDTGTLKQRVAAAEKVILIAALDKNNWHITNTAKELGLADHSSLHKILKRHNLKKK